MTFNSVDVLINTRDKQAVPIIFRNSDTVTYTSAMATDSKITLTDVCISRSNTRTHWVVKSAVPRRLYSKFIPLIVLIYKTLNILNFKR